MKRKTRKSGKKVPMLWDESMDFEVAITPMADPDPELDTKIIMLPLPNITHKFQPPPMAA